MIWALLAMYFFSGSAALSGAVLTSADVTELKEKVAIVIDEGDRRKVAIATLNDLQENTKSFEETFTRVGKTLSKFYAEHDDDRELANAALAELNAKWSEGQARAIDARFALREQLTEQEWAALFERE